MYRQAGRLTGGVGAAVPVVTAKQVAALIAAKDGRQRIWKANVARWEEIRVCAALAMVQAIA